MRPDRHAPRPDRQRAALRQLDTAGAGHEPRGDEPIGVHHVPTGVDPLALDHVALSVADPEAMAAFLCDRLGMQRLTSNAVVTVVGAGAPAATLALVAAEGPREAGSLERLVLRVADVERAIALLPAGTAVDGDGFMEATFEGPEGLGLGFTFMAGGGIDNDLDHVDLLCAEREQTWAAFIQSGFVPRGDTPHIADKYIALAQSSTTATQRPLLHHIGVRVDSIAAVVAHVDAFEVEVDERAPDGACAIVLPGPERIGLRFVEQPLRG